MFAIESFYSVISELISSIRDDISILYKVSDAIGSLDLIQSLANYAIVTPRCVRPSFATYTTAITMGRHPILDSISAEPTVPNNTVLYARDLRNGKDGGVNSISCDFKVLNRYLQLHVDYWT